MATRRRFVETNGIRMHLAEQGSGPLVVLLHGFPELWYSWRHQLDALAEAGFHAVAPDLRGYGQTDIPDDASTYTQFHVVGDVIGLFDALNEQQAVIVGHDWGAALAWTMALVRPDRVRGVAALSVPYRPRGSMSALAAIRARFGERFYQVYFQTPGVADAEFNRDPKTSLRKLLFSASGDSPISDQPSFMMVPEGASGWLDAMIDPPELPAWLTERDLQAYADEFQRTGFTGGLNYYRNIQKNWELLAPWRGARVQPPALFVAGARDLVVSFPGARDALAQLQDVVPNLRQQVLIPGAGHWTQQERPAETNAALLDFLRGL
ncbi:MAG TPA: alpha/beta hydrolase [Chloroflexota bacterium]|jgi:pimeloyl-ACP methyl ester carboxylesterase